MLPYASPDRFAPGRRSPATLALIVAGHVGLVALALSAKMIVDRHHDSTTISFVPNDPPPPPPDPRPKVEPRRDPVSTVTQSKVDLPPLDPPPLATDTLPPKGPTGPVAGSGGGAGTTIPPLPPLVHSGPVAITPPNEVMPPYPVAKQDAGEEATLTLALTISPTGRVTAVTPLGRADPIFLDAARRHILSHWRYRPARDGDTPVGSSLNVTVHFRLDA
ncbi:energy transducer TonB [Sphingomonas sp. ASV193]|uniref:energy transducer TonB n=1 Tax=Sphingomonas sp. ASV193 TaxID=3144405 RepID=UPI0032E91EAE